MQIPFLTQLNELIVNGCLQQDDRQRVGRPHVHVHVPTHICTLVYFRNEDNVAISANVCLQRTVRALRYFVYID